MGLAGGSSVALLMEGKCKEVEAVSEGEVGGAEGLTFMLLAITFWGNPSGEGVEALWPMVPLITSCSVYNQSEAGCSLSPLPSINLMNRPVGAGQPNTLMSETTPGGISRSSMKYIILLLIRSKYNLSQSTGFEVTRQKHEKTSPRSVSFQYDHFPAVAAIIAGGTTHSPRSGANDRISGCQAFSDVLGFKDGAVYPMIQGIMSTGPGLILVPSFVPILLFFGINYTSFPSVQS